MAGSAVYKAILAEHRARFDRVTQRVAPQQLKKLYDRAQASLIAKLRAKIRAGLGDSMTAYQHRLLLAQIRSAQMALANQLASQMSPVTQQAQVEALRGLAADITRLERTYGGADIVLPIEEASRFSAIVARSRPTLLRVHESSFRRYGSVLVGKMEGDLALSLATGETPGEAIDRVQKTADVEWWRGERIVRTETAAAFNTTVKDGMEAAAQELPDLRMRWSEHVDPATGAPLDDRVAVDSLAMNGQVAAPGAAFTMPPTSEVPDHAGNTIVPRSLAGKTFTSAPCRPNGREVLQPWRPHWGIPGWRWDGSRRVPVTK